MRPATASFGERGLAREPSSSRRPGLWSIRRPARPGEVFGPPRGESPAPRWTRARPRPRREPNGEGSRRRSGEAVAVAADLGRMRRSSQARTESCAPQPGQQRPIASPSRRPRGRRCGLRGPSPGSGAGGPRRPGRARPSGPGAGTSREEDLPARWRNRARGTRRARPPPRRRSARRPPAGAAPGWGAAAVDQARSRASWSPPPPRGPRSDCARSPPAPSPPSRSAKFPGCPCAAAGPRSLCRAPLRSRSGAHQVPAAGRTAGPTKPPPSQQVR